MPEDLSERIRHAVQVLASDSPEGSIREQAEALLSGEMSDDCLQMLTHMADEVGGTIFRRSAERGVNPIVSVHASRVSILVAGMAVGKRLGVEEGERFGKITASLMACDDPEADF